MRKKNSSLREMAYMDNLTGVYNRRGLAKFLALAAEPCARPRNFATHALLVDVDDFKAVNDIFGYSSGDQALKDLSRRIRALLGPYDAVARIGGDEFLVLTSGVDMGGAVAMAENIRASIADARSTRSFRITVSVGVAAMERRPYTLEGLLDLTQGALKLGKGGGKNRVCFDSGSAVQGKAPTLIQVPFFEILSRRMAGYRFTIPGRPGSPDLGPQSVEEMRELLCAAQAKGGGLECHLEISHLLLMRLDPNDLVLGPDFEPWRMRLSVPEIPMSPLPPGLLEVIRRFQRAGWGLGLRGLDLGAHGWSNLILLEPVVVTLGADLVVGISADHERLRNVLRFRRALSGLGAAIVADGVESSEDLKA
ncbi:MAG: GGDEF domain-containing protein, partial [bacterium]